MDKFMRNSSQNRISIIVPVYNVEKYIEECITSLLQQDYLNFEIIAVNDGSTDSSLKILERLSSEDSRLKVFSKVNEGVSSARNYALEKVSGEYVLFIDSDDLLADRALSTVASVATKNMADIVIFGFRKFYTDTDFEKTNKLVNKARQLSKLEMLRLAFDDSFKTSCCNGAYTCARLYRTELLRNIRFDSSRLIYEDEDFTSRLILTLTNLHKIFLIDAPIYYYRQRNSSLVHSNRAKRLFALYSCRRAIAKRFNTSLVEYKIVEKARFTALTKLVQTSLAMGRFSGFSLFQKILWKRNDIPFFSKLPYLLGRFIAQRYSIYRLEKSKKKNSHLAYWE